MSPRAAGRHRVAEDEGPFALVAGHAADRKKTVPAGSRTSSAKSPVFARPSVTAAGSNGASCSTRSNVADQFRRVDA